MSCLHPEEHPLVVGLELEHEHTAGRAGRNSLASASDKRINSLHLHCSQLMEAP
jgi:hypothetical protein